MVGPGWSGDQLTEPGSVLDGVRGALADVSAQAGRDWARTAANWSGAGAEAAADFASATVAAADTLADHAAALGSHTVVAAAAVARADQRLRAIVERFEARAAALEPHLDEPGVAEELVAEAQRSLDEAIAVVDELRAELDRQQAGLTGPAPPGTASPSTAPAGFAGAPAGVTGGGGPSGLGGVPAAGPGAGFDDLALAEPPEAAVPLGDPATFGDGEAIRLPDGSTAMAPNAVAADAVRHALTQLGVPYDWGGTTPGVGLDCSGLTQWAYHEAGLNIPRLAQEQDVGAGVDPGSLRPGDLAVWDGHVAMIVGNGQMIEAGDPVQLSAIRTTNAGQGFHGFFRPTA